MAETNAQRSIQRLAQELLELSKTYHPSDDGFSEPEIIMKAKQIITAAQTPYSHTMSTITGKYTDG